MKSIALFMIMYIIICSYKKAMIINEPPIIENNLYTPKDSSSSTINGKTFICTQSGSRSTSVSPTNFSLLTNSYPNTDTALYAQGYTFLSKLDDYSTPVDFARIELAFAKKMILSKINPTSSLFQFPNSSFDSSYFKVGFFGFATDYKRFNNKEGIAMSVDYKNPLDSLDRDRYSSYSIKPPYITSSVNNTSQNNSTFQIVKVYEYKGSKIVEAKFELNAFNASEQMIRVTNGFVRFSYYN